MPPGFKKVPLTPDEVMDCLRAFGAVELPARATSHRQFHCWVRGVQKTVTFDTSVREFVAETRSPLWGIVRSQLGVEYHEFYAADPKVARRPRIAHRLPDTGRLSEA